MRHSVIPKQGSHGFLYKLFFFNAVAIAEEMGLPADRIQQVRQSAFLHDIGKLAIPETILHKPGKLTEIEVEFIKKHAEIGADLLASIKV